MCTTSSHLACPGSNPSTIVINGITSLFSITHLISSSDFSFFFFLVMGFRLRALCLVGRHPTTWTIPPAFFFFFFGGTEIWTQGFMLAKQALYHLSHTCSPFCCGYFGDRVSQTICLGWLPTSVLLISAFQITGITGVELLVPGLPHSFKQLLLSRDCCGLFKSSLIAG
jgi:hypothetical protein